MDQERILSVFKSDNYPQNDGWFWLYKVYEIIAPAETVRRNLICRYLFPTSCEIAGKGQIYRWLGVPVFGKVIPTGGIVIRRITGARMRPYTLSGVNIQSAIDFYFRACVFEVLHLPFFLVLSVLSLHRIVTGQYAYAIQEILINFIVNLYPMMHHRNTRRRIVKLVDKLRRKEQSNI